LSSREDIPDSMLLDASFVPASPGLEPSIALYPPIDLSPGAWRRAEEALAIPEAARRLMLPVGDPATPRYVPCRVLTLPEALPFLLGIGDTKVRQSVTAWRIAATVAQRIHEQSMAPRGNEATDRGLESLAGSLPDTARAVLTEPIEAYDDLFGPPASGKEDDELEYVQLDARHALFGFLDAARETYALGLRPREVQRKKTSELKQVTLVLGLPKFADGAWPLTVTLPDETRQAKEAVLDAVRHASALFAPLTRLGGNTEMELNSDEASALVRIADRLREQGATIQVPGELERGLERKLSAKVRLSKRTGSSGSGRFRLDDLVRYNLSVALGGREVDAAELRELAKRADGLVRVADEWVALDDAARERLEKLARAIEHRDAELAGAAALSAALAGSVDVAGLHAVVDKVDDELLERTLNYLKSPTEFPAIKPGKGFVGELRPYQERGVEWMGGMTSLGLGACLADDMGLGKTVQVIALLTNLQDAARDERRQHRTMVVCPTSLIGNWQRELERFAPGTKVHVHHGPQRVARQADMGEFDVLVTSYGLVARDRALLASIDFDLIVFDEAQAVKNPDTEQARACRNLYAPMKIALTGTPMENRLLELWSILDLLNPALLGTSRTFSRRFAQPIERANDAAAAETLRAIVRPFLLRRTKRDPEIVPDLPEKQEHSVVCTLTAEQAALYQATVDTSLSDLRQRDGIGRRGGVLALITRLKQICNHPAQALRETEPLAGRSGKLDRLRMMVEEVVEAGDKSLVFTQYAQMGNLLASYLPEELGCPVLYMHGGVPRMQREALIKQFQEAEEAMVFVLSLKTGGLGLNLMAAAHVFHYDRWWNPAVEDQATDRTHRIGQTRQIQVHKLVCAGTLEERIAQVLEEKRALAGRVIEAASGGEGWITELTDDELEALVSLQTPEAQPA
jgi:superfamily II DNA or RNA helicase